MNTTPCTFIPPAPKHGSVEPSTLRYLGAIVFFRSVFDVNDGGLLVIDFSGSGVLIFLSFFFLLRLMNDAVLYIYTYAEFN